MYFHKILGHRQVINQLQLARRTGRLGTASLFCGATGIGRRTVMIALGAALLCHAGGEEACGKCESCRLIVSGGHPDWVVLDTTKDVISVDEIREFCRQISMAPSTGKVRVCLNMAADRMNVNASNCFLKTLEEPPATAQILLRSESPDRLLGTILSRCRVVRMGPLSIDSLRHELTTRGIDHPTEIALLAEGSLGRALALAEGSSVELVAALRHLLSDLRPGMALSLADDLLARSAKSSGSSPQEILDTLALLLRQQLRNGIGLRQVLNRLDAVYEAAERIRKNVTADLVFRALSLNLCHL